MVSVLVHARMVMMMMVMLVAPKMRRCALNAKGVMVL